MRIMHWIGKLTGDPSRTAFDRLAKQIEARARELKDHPGHPGLCCERTRSQIRIYRRPYPRITVELDFEEQFRIVGMRRYRLDHPAAEARLITNLRYPVSGARRLGRADYRRLAQQVLLPLLSPLHR